MANPSVVIDIAAEYTGKKAFDKAGKSTTGLEKSVKKLGKAFVGVFAAQKVLAFGKASVKAFAEDERSAAALTQTLKNLSLGFANVGIEDFVTKMSLSTGVADDQLRPAMQRLLQTSLDVAQSQKLMGLALDISAAGFGDVTSVAGDLSQAMVGNVKGIKKYNLGITQAELATMSFAQIQERLTQAFKGQAAAAADTYAGKLNIIKNAAGEAQEAIGKSLIDALMDIGDNQDMQGLVDDILAAGEGVGYLISGIGDLVKKLGSIPGLGFEGVGKNAPMPFTLNPLAILAQQAYKDQLSEIYKLETKRYENARKLGWLLSDPTPGKDSILTREEAIAGMTPAQKRKEEADKKAAAAAAKARAAELKSIKDLAAKKALADKLAAAKKKKADELAAANLAKLAKANSLFDLDNIQIEAALKGKISEEEKTRLLLMRAILEEDAATAEKLGKKLADIQKINFQIAADLAIIAATKDPFTTWAGSLSLALVELAKYNKALTDVPNVVPGVNYNPSQNADRNYDLLVQATEEAVAALAAEEATAAVLAAQDALEALVIPDTNNIPTTTTNNPMPSTDLYGFSLPDYLKTGSNFAGGAYTPPAAEAPITVIVQGNVLDGDGFTDAVNKAMLNAQRRGLTRSPAGAIATP
jgi:hypothetical protein